MAGVGVGLIWAVFEFFALLRLCSGSLQAHAEVEEPLEIVAGAHQRPFKADLFLAAQQEAAEADRFLDDAKDRFDGLLAQAVELFAAGCV